MNGDGGPLRPQNRQNGVCVPGSLHAGLCRQHLLGEIEARILSDIGRHHRHCCPEGSCRRHPLNLSMGITLTGVVKANENYTQNNLPAPYVSLRR